MFARDRYPTSSSLRLENHVYLQKKLSKVTNMSCNGACPLKALNDSIERGALSGQSTDYDYYAVSL